MIANKKIGCPTCCICGIYHEMGGQSDQCLKLLAQQLNCRLAYNFPPKNENNPNSKYKNICEVILNGEYENVEKQSSNFQKCMKGKASADPDQIADARRVCGDAGDVPAWSECPFFGYKGGPDGSCGNSYTMIDVTPDGGCNGHRFYKCVPERDWECRDAPHCYDVCANHRYVCLNDYTCDCR